MENITHIDEENVEVFLTGGTGFIGKKLTQVMLDRGWGVRALVRTPGGANAQILQKMGAQILEGDITERDSMRAGMAGTDVVIHTAGVYELGPDPKTEKRMTQINIMGTENVLSLARELGVSRTLHVASVVALGETGTVMRDETYQRQVPCKSTYSCTKTEGYQIARQYQAEGEPVVIVNPAPVVGVNDHSTFGYALRMYINRVLPPVAWSPESIFCCVDVADLAEGIALAAEKGRDGESYMLTGQSQTLREIFQTWKSKPGRFIPRVWLPVPLVLPIFGVLEPIQRMIGLPAVLSRETVRTVATNMYYSNQKAQRELGWSFRPADVMWHEAIEGEIEMLEKREGQSLVERLKPLEGIL